MIRKSFRLTNKDVECLNSSEKPAAEELRGLLNFAMQNPIPELDGLREERVTANYYLQDDQVKWLEEFSDASEVIRFLIKRRLAGREKPPENLKEE